MTGLEIQLPLIPQNNSSRAEKMCNSISMTEICKKTIIFQMPIKCKRLNVYNKYPQCTTQTDPRNRAQHFIMKRQNSLKVKAALKFVNPLEFSRFLHKYETKRKQNPIKQKR